MAQLVPVKITRVGTAPVFVAASAGGDTFPNDGRTYLHVKNASAGPVNVTINSARQCDQGFDHDVVVSVPAGGERMIGPFPTGRFNADGLASVTYSAVASVTVAAVQV